MAAITRTRRIKPGAVTPWLSVANLALPLLPFGYERVKDFRRKRSLMTYLEDYFDKQPEPKIIPDSVRKAMDEMDTKKPTWRLGRTGQIASRIQERQQLASQSSATHSVSEFDRFDSTHNRRHHVRGHDKNWHDQSSNNTSHRRSQHCDYPNRILNVIERSPSPNESFRGRSEHVGNRSRSRDNRRCSSSCSPRHISEAQSLDYAQLEEGRLDVAWAQSRTGQIFRNDSDYSVNSGVIGHRYGEEHANDTDLYAHALQTHDYECGCPENYGGW